MVALWFRVLGFECLIGSGGGIEKSEGVWWRLKPIFGGGKVGESIAYYFGEFENGGKRNLSLR